jgi:invasion protein IalB
MWRSAFLIIALIGLCSARAENPAAEPSTVISLAWSRFCLKSTKPGTQVCFTGQKPLTRCDKPVASVNLYDDPTVTRLSVNLRQQVAMERGVRIAIDQDKTIFSGPFFQCDANGCLAVHESGPELIAQLKGGQMLNVEATDSAGQPVKVAFSLTGFADAYYPRAPLDPAAHGKAGWEHWHALLSRAQGWRGPNAGKADDCVSGR